jgi:hydrogenase maturation protease
LGPAFLDAMERRINGNVEWLTDFQLQVEHALDMQHRELVLFVDASVSCAAPFEFFCLVPEADTSITTHAISPASVLEVYRRLFAAEPPPAFLLSIRGERFELEEGLSPFAGKHLTDALSFGERLFERPKPQRWLAMQTEAGALV